MSLNLAISNIKDDVTRQNFQKIMEEFALNPFLKSTFRLYEVSPRGADSSYQLKHNLGFQPTDVFISYVSNDATVSIDFSKTDKTFVVVSFSKACTSRIIAGGFSV